MRSHGSRTLRSSPEAAEMTQHEQKPDNSNQPRKKKKMSTSTLIATLLLVVMPISQGNPVGVETFKSDTVILENIRAVSFVTTAPSTITCLVMVRELS